MIPILKRLPEKVITRIPGPRNIGSRRSSARWGILPPAGGGVPSGDMINIYASNHGGAPTFFALSDGGAGYIPWGFWQVAIYPLGGLPPGITENLAFGFLEADPTTDAVTVATDLLLKILQLRAQGVAAGFPNAAKIRTPVNPTIVDLGGGDLRAGFGFTAPYGPVDLSAFYTGQYWISASEDPLPMVDAFGGYDNPLLLALWSPGNRAILRLAEPPGPRRYYYSPTPYIPPAPPAPVTLRTAGDFRILAKSGVTNIPTSAIVGDVGVSPIAASGITGMPLTLDGGGVFSTTPQVTGLVMAADYAAPAPALLTQAVLDMQAAYLDAASRTPNVVGLLAGLLNGQTLSAGVYKWTTGVTISGDITLTGDASSVFIFQISGVLSLAANKNIILSGGVLPSNVFWQVAGNTAIGAGANFRGVILDATDLTMGAGAVLTGRALSQTAVNLNANTVS